MTPIEPPREVAPSRNPEVTARAGLTERVNANLLDAGTVLWKFTHDAMVDPDTTLRTQAGPLAEALRRLADGLLQTSEVPPERFLPPGTPTDGIIQLLLEGRYLAYEILRFEHTVRELADAIPRLKAESVPFQRELSALESIARRLIGIQAVTQERREVIRAGEFDAVFAQRRIAFVASEMRGLAEECLRFRAQVAFAFVKQIAKGEPL